MLTAGYFRVGRLAGADLRLHWSVPVGALVFGSLRFEPFAWLAYFVVILVHELGHALLLRGLGLTIAGLDVTGFGGHCRFRGSADALDHAIIAWGGVLAQGLLLLGTLAAGLIGGHATSHGGMLVEHTFIEVNAWILALNLLPFAPLDGARAWRLFPELTLRGWTVPRLLFHPIWRWADRRRKRRSDESESGPRQTPARVVRATPRRRVSPVPAVSEADADASADDDIGEKPSAQAQRELAALLERIGDEAARAKKRR